MRTYKKHRTNAWGGWNKYSCLPFFLLPTIWKEARSYHNGREWEMHIAWLRFHFLIQFVTAGLLEKNQGNPEYDPSDWEEHPSIWWHIMKRLHLITD